jgi:predicted small secreted protein
MAMKFTILLAVTGLAVIFGTSCNTTIGLGRDMRILGESMETQAEKTRGGGAADTSGAPVY